MKKKLTVLVIIILVFFTISFLWWNQAVKSPRTNDQALIPFIVERGETARSIAERLHKKNLIRSPVAFFLYARFTDTASNFQAGEFQLNPSMNMYEIAESLKHGTMDVIITIPEGLRNEEIALKLAKDLNIPESEYLKFAKEGYMFPDTYHFPKDATIEEVIATFNENFNKKVNTKLINRANMKNMTIDELITIASLVEREARLDKDRPLVASVILNRLKIGMKLDIDATIQYALGYQPKSKSWWKKSLTRADLEIESPFNTYKNPGLPPTPISNPGLESIQSVLSAPDTDYLYYLSDVTGKTYFSSNLEEHNNNIEKYLN